MKIDYIENKIGKDWISEYDEIGKMLSSLIGRIKKELAND
jgi:hypothetical protein